MDELARRTCERVPGYSFPASGDLICVSEAACGFTHHEDDLPANHCNGRFHVVGKSQRAHFHHRVKQYSTRRRSAMSKRPRRDQHPSTCKVSALAPPAPRARRPGHYTDDCTARAARAWLRISLCLCRGWRSGSGSRMMLKTATPVRMAQFASFSKS